MPSAGFEPAIQAIKRSQTDALDSTASEISYSIYVGLLNRYIYKHIISLLCDICASVQ